MARQSRLRPTLSGEDEQAMRERGAQGELFATDETTCGDTAKLVGISEEMARLDQSVIDAAGPIVKSNSFQRLRNVTFLGILSPRYATLPGHPLMGRRARKKNLGCDGSRADHSLAIAALVARFCDVFSLSTNAKRYGVAWALIHDIATWPLSHTGEVAFSDITGVTHKHLRRKMVIGDAALPSEFHLSLQLREMGVDPDHLILFFENTETYKSTQDNLELLRLHSFIHSAITPDTLEGIHRSGVAIGIQVPDPVSILDSFEIREVDYINDTIVRKRNSKAVLEFWRQKKKIYEMYINAPRTVAFESRWSHGIKEAFKCTSMAESLRLIESDVVERVSEIGLPVRDSVLRYKAPQKYFLDDSLKRKRMLCTDYPIENLNEILKRGKKEMEAE